MSMLRAPVLGTGLTLCEPESNRFALSTHDQSALAPPQDCARLPCFRLPTRLSQEDQFSNQSPGFAYQLAQFLCQIIGLGQAHFSRAAALAVLNGVVGPSQRERLSTFISLFYHLRASRTESNAILTNAGSTQPWSSSRVSIYAGEFPRVVHDKDGIDLQGVTANQSIERANGLTLSLQRCT
jgi:hypothetical protein